MKHPKLEKVEPSFVHKGWGSEKILFNDEELCGKVLYFNKGSEFSTHSHILKYEFFLVLKGKLQVTGINTEDASKYQIELDRGEVLRVPRGAFHRIKALEESEIVEFSTHHEDSDSYRILPGDSQKSS
jgi:quercetin dioxygenase-like cupin family protein